MNLEVDLNALKVTVFSTVFIFFKLFVTLWIQGGKRFKAGSRPPEDAMFKMGGEQNFGIPSEGPSTSDSKSDSTVLAAKESDIRWQRIVQNDLENIPVAFLVIWASLLSNSQPFVHMFGCIIYVTCRALHTYCYANQLQPHRTVVWSTGVLAEIVIAINALICVFLLK